ncbi:hypothetical protein [Nocardia sp. NRRL S-836]|uniref:hypothetical protein n=1 Tax=Nocardia sp. NRRL S-836 TaxID=1519492 RepID=UPI0006B061F8|nr:hypothetical protein [Nocardia sp. NRRL S-836]KOV81405.1 hypothetical protein ADL03_28365 [Nocardia sp. NRRL S-836]
MTNVPPPTRDLPPGRQAQLRAEVERAVTGRSTRRVLVPVLAGAAAVAAAVTGVVVLQPNTDPRPAVHITTSPTPEPRVRDTFGLSPEKLAAIEEGCARSERVPGKLTVHQFGRDDAGEWALLHGDRVVVACNLGRGGEEYDTDRPSDVALHWLPGRFSLDVDLARLGGDLHPTIPAMAGVPGLRFVAGRVDPSVVRLTYRAYDGRTVDAKIANGTYVVRIAYPATWNPNDVTGAVELRAYDAAGGLLGTSAEITGSCYYAPDSGEVVHGRRGVTAENCKPATPWR